MKKIFLDDLREAPKGWIDVRNYDEMVGILKTLKGEEFEVSLDHDLGETKTGYDVCKWMVENECYPTVVTIHTANPVGAKNMFQLLDRYAPKNVIIKSKYANR